MKKIIFFFLFQLALAGMINASVFPNTNQRSIAEPGASFQKMWIDYGVTAEGRYGMMMHIALTVYNMKDVLGQLTCYFRYADGKPDSWIRHSKAPDKYHTAGGYLAAFENLTPRYDASVYDDVQVFFPYDEFYLDAGNYDITIDVQYKYVTGATVSWLQLYDIEFTSYGTSRGAGSTPAKVSGKPIKKTGPRAVLDSMWVDYDVRQGGELGMLLHFKFVAYEMKDKEALIGVYFLYNDANGTTLKDKNGQYASYSGNVAVYYDIKPSYDEAIYDDAKVFMPYSELELAPGKYDLGMESKLIYKEGGLISNFIYKGFRYTQP